MKKIRKLIAKFHKKMAAGNRDQWIVIGVSGVTCGGKTTLSNQLLRRIRRICVFHQDKYFYPDDSPHHVPVPGMKHNNYDILGALDMAAMYNDVVSTIHGTDKSHERGVLYGPDEARAQPAVSGVCGIDVPGKNVVIVEGFTVLNYKPLFQLCDLRYYMVLDYGECFARRVHRLYDPPDVPGYFEKCVWPEHVKYRRQIENEPGVTILDATRFDAYDIVMRDLRRFGAREV